VGAQLHELGEAETACACRHAITTHTLSLQAGTALLLCSCWAPTALFPERVPPPCVFTVGLRTLSEGVKSRPPPPYGSVLWIASLWNLL
jgi:hypothetical protein